MIFASLAMQSVLLGVRVSGGSGKPEQSPGARLQMSVNLLRR